MTTPSGQISLNDVNVELGFAGTTLITMNQADVRTLAGVGGSGTPISMQDLQGKSNRVSISYTFSSNTANASLNLSSIGGYSSGKSDITVTVNSGVYLYSTSTGGYGLSFSGGTTGDTLTVVNNGLIMGQGGTGGAWSGGAQSGGAAIYLGFGMSSCTINNTNASAYIGGGGGGGGSAYLYDVTHGGGGGVGGGPGGAGRFTGKGGPQVAPGGSGGSIGGSGGDGTQNMAPGGGGGGRVFPGVGGTGPYGAGNGKTGGGSGCGPNQGAGGSSNNAGGAGGEPSSSVASSGGGGGWGASGGAGGTGPGGGNGGKAVNLNGKSVTWTSGNTTRVWGAVS